MRVFITDLGSSIATELARNCQDAGLEVVGTIVRGGKAEMAKIRRQLHGHPRSDVAGAIQEPLALQKETMKWRQLVHQSDIVVVTALATDPKGAIETLKAFQQAAMVQDDLESKEEKSDDRLKRFIALSSVLSWSKNAPFAASTAGKGHDENDFKARRPARKYTELKTTETQILSAHRTGEFEVCVIGAGLIYGGAQSQLHLIFREAWLHPDRPLLVPSLATQGQLTSQGHNLLPMISVYDLALLVFRVAASPSPPPKKYLIAVDKASGNTTLRDVCRGVSTLLASGRLRDYEDLANDVDTDAVLLLNEEEELVTPLQLHLRFDTSTSAMHTLVASDEWRHYSHGLVGNLAFFVEDFLRVFDLRPLRTVILGAPCVGKTLLSQKLAKEYYLPYLSPATLLHELYDANLPEDESVETMETIKLRQDLQQWSPNGGDSEEKVLQLPESALVSLIRWKLRSAACRNQGYVLDGMPVSAAQAREIFMPELNSDEKHDGNTGDDESKSLHQVSNDQEPREEETNEDVLVDVDSLLARLKPQRHIDVPNRVVVLQGPRALLEMHAQALSETEAERTANTQEAFARRFDAFEANFEALEAFFEKPSLSNATEGVEVLEIGLRDEHGYCDEASFATPIQQYMQEGGQAPRNFHPTLAEVREQRRIVETQARQAEVRAAELLHEQNALDEATQQLQLARERARLELVQREEAELLEARAKPLRLYLMDTVLPALTEGMLQVIKVQPTDPIDYLAEFLFRKGQELEDEASIGRVE